MTAAAGVDRTLPHNLDAERSVLGSVLVNAKAFAIVAALISADDFYRQAHAKIFRSMQRLDDAGTAVDGITLKNELDKSGDLEDVGGPTYIYGLADGVPRSTNAEHYARIVAEKAMLRRAIYTANKLLDNAYSAEVSAEPLVDWGVQQLLTLAKPSEGGAVTIGAAMTQWMATFEGARELGFSTGLTDLDALLLGGLHPKELVMIAGRPSMGKSTLMMNLAEAVAAAKIPTAVFTLEMAPTALVESSLARHAQVDAHRIRARVLREEDYARLSRAMEEIHDLPLWFIERASTLTQIQAWCRRLSDQGVRLFCVDYIQRMGKPDARDRRLEIDYISRGFQRLASDLDAVFVVLSQLTRASEHRTDKRPQLGDLKESGGLEADADTVILIYRDEAYNREPENPNAGIAELIIAKQRFGPTGVVKVAFLREQLRFANLMRS